MKQGIWPRGFLWLWNVGIALLTYAALDDITTGGEPGFFLEWLMVGCAAAWLFGLAAVRLRG